WNTLATDTFSGLGNHTVDGGSSPDATPPTAPTNLTSSNITQTSVNLTWSASTDNVAVTGYQVFNGATLVTTTTNLNYTVTGLTAATAYTFSVKAKDAANNVSAASNTVNITTLANAISYCASKGNNVNYEYIDNVAIGGISNVTGANSGYGDFTAQIGNLTYGNNTIIVSAGFASSSYTEYWKVWIDFNKNGTFESTEEVVSGSSSSAGNLSYTFSVPSSALAGTTRMRVAMKWNGAPTSCETFSYGEVEDYTVNIGASAKGFNTSTIKADAKLGNEAPIFAVNLFPNPTSNSINIHLKDGRKANYTITNTIGQIVKKGLVTREPVKIQSLKAGIYFIEIRDANKAFTKKFIKK
ncbi:predicted protein, partial [Nematostella vectensis]